MPNRRGTRNGKLHGVRSLSILLTNDDGIDAPGLRALARALGAMYDVTIVAPDAERSGQSHAITAGRPVEVRERTDLDAVAYACSGTTADCVVLGIRELAPRRPNLVVSGINMGPNLADDVNYSGTVAGAVEATLLGVPAMAVSLAASLDDDRERCLWDDAAGVVAALVPSAVQLIREGIYWNVNIPHLPRAELRGVRVTRSSRKRHLDRALRVDEHLGARYFRVWTSPLTPGVSPDESDVVAVENGYVSVTPLLLDRTATEEIRPLRDALRSLLPPSLAEHRA